MLSDLASTIGHGVRSVVDPVDPHRIRRIRATRYNNTGLAVAVFHAGINSMGVFHPTDVEALAPGGVPDTALNLLAEVTGAVPLVLLAVVLVVVYRAQDRTIPDAA